MTAAPGSSRASGNVTELLECPICYVQFDRPLQLSCGHTFCSACVDRLVENARGGAGGGVGAAALVLQRMHEDLLGPMQDDLDDMNNIFNDMVNNADRRDPAADMVRIRRRALGDAGREAVPPAPPGGRGGDGAAAAGAAAGEAGAARDDPNAGLGGAMDAARQERRLRHREDYMARRGRGVGDEMDIDEPYPYMYMGYHRGPLPQPLLGPLAPPGPPPFVYRGGFGRPAAAIDAHADMQAARDRMAREREERVRERERHLLNRVMGAQLEGDRERGRAAGVQIRCPECRKPTTIPTGGLPVNYRLQDMISRLAATIAPGTKAERVDPIKCLNCNDALQAGVYFTCKTCCAGENTNAAKQMCSTCGIRHHNGHEIEEMRALTDKDLADTKEAIGLQTARATNVMEQVQAHISQLSTDGKNVVEQVLTDGMRSFAVIAGGLDNLFDNTLETLAARTCKAEKLASKYEEILGRTEAIVQMNKGACDQLAQEVQQFLNELGVAGMMRRIKQEPDDGDDVILIDTPVGEPAQVAVQPAQPAAAVPPNLPPQPHAADPPGPGPSNARTPRVDRGNYDVLANRLKEVQRLREHARARQIRTRDDARFLQHQTARIAAAGGLPPNSIHARVPPPPRVPLPRRVPPAPPLPPLDPQNYFGRPPGLQVTNALPQVYIPLIAQQNQTNPNDPRQSGGAVPAAAGGGAGAAAGQTDRAVQAEPIDLDVPGLGLQAEVAVEPIIQRAERMIISPRRLAQPMRRTLSPVRFPETIDKNGNGWCARTRTRSGNDDLQNPLVGQVVQRESPAGALPHGINFEVVMGAAGSTDSAEGANSPPPKRRSVALTISRVMNPAHSAPLDPAQPDACEPGPSTSAACNPSRRKRGHSLALAAVSNVGSPAADDLVLINAEDVEDLPGPSGINDGVSSMDGQQNVDDDVTSADPPVLVAASDVEMDNTSGDSQTSDSTQ